MTSARAPDATCGAEHCITCGDEGIPMTVLRIDQRRGLALCIDEEGSKATVETALVEPVALGDQVLVHAGTAIAALTSSVPEPAR
jgi:hydrogenase assembly chaperone HypC/HupF